jgi:hypothetical protein
MNLEEDFVEFPTCENENFAIGFIDLHLLGAFKDVSRVLCLEIACFIKFNNP